MGQVVKKILQNTALTLGSLLVFFLVAELIVFRFVIPATDIPRNAFIDGVIRHQPDQRGYARIANDEAIPYAINHQGWNSAHAHYRLEKAGDLKRIAVIGDSYVEALSVPYDQSVAENLEKRLNAEGETAEIYRFGISGAPLSQYLYMLEQEVVRYDPDLVILLLIHNDFDESFRFKAGRYTSSFLKLKMDGDDVINEIEPAAYEEGWLEYLRMSATFRYVFYQKKLHPQAIRQLVFGQSKTYEANVEVDRIERQWQQIQAATDYLFRRIREASTRHDVNLLFVMDANRQDIYADRSSAESKSGVSKGGAAKLNGLASELAARHGIPFLDLGAPFAADWEKNRSHFEFPDDNHWNRRGHAKAAEAIAAFIDSECLLDCGPAL